jgi:ATP-binding cassette subfamily B protein
VAFNVYLGLLAWPTVALGWIINAFQRGASAMARIGEVLDSVPDIPPALDLPRARGSEPAEVAGDVEIRGLTFAYPGTNGTAVLSGIDLSIPAGSRVALVGPVGSGKSTLVQLLARFYAVPDATIFVGGRDVNEIPPSELRRSIGFVPQEAFLFSRTLAENVALGRPAATGAEIERAVERAHLSRAVAALPHGLATPVGERGYALSGGQRQRATLARALLIEPRILILDDSLSSVDADTERGILEALEDPARARTLILVSHRLSTLSGIDRIVVLDGGRIVESGTHAHLLARRGAYAALFQRQLLEQRLAGP